MMSKELLKKAGIVSVAFGMLASPLAFAQTDEQSSIDENQGITADEQPIESHSSGTEHGANMEKEDLTTDYDTQGPDTIDEPDSMEHGDDSEYTPEEVVEENSDS